VIGEAKSLVESGKRLKGVYPIKARLESGWLANLTT